MIEQTNFEIGDKVKYKGKDGYHKVYTMKYVTIRKIKEGRENDGGQVIDFEEDQDRGWFSRNWELYKPKSYTYKDLLDKM